MRAECATWLPLVVCLVGLAPPAAADWPHSVAGTGTVRFPSLVLDSSDQPILVFGGTDLREAELGGTSWSVSLIAPEKCGFGGTTYSSLALGPADAPGVAQIDKRGGRILFHERVGGAWRSELVAAIPARGVSLAYDPQGEPAVAAVVGATDTELRLYRRNQGRWSAQAIAGTGSQMDGQLALAFDTGGLPAIAVSTAGWPLFAKFDGLDWSVTSLTLQGDAADGSLAYDGAGVAWLAIGGTQGIRVLHGSPGAWAQEIVDLSGSTGQARLALRAGEIWVAWYSIISVGIGAGRRQGSSWSVSTVGPASSGESLGLALDAMGNPRIASLAGSSGRRTLDYRVWDGSSWRAEVVLAETDAGHSPSLAFDGAGQPFIAHVDESARELRLESFDGSTWRGEIVEAGGAYSVTDLEIHQSTGATAIAHASSGAIRVAQRSGASWRLDTVESFGAGVGQLSLAFDRVGTAHVAYCGGGVTGVRFAVWDGQQWNAEQVVARASGASCALAFDGLDRALVAWGQDGDSLHLSTRTGTIWSDEILNARYTGRRLISLDLAVSGLGERIVAYSEKTEGVQVLSFDGTTWTAEQAHGSGPGVSRVSLDVSGAGEVALAVPNNGTVWLAQRVSLGWVQSAVGESFEYPGAAFAYSPTGQGCLAFADGCGGTLRYSCRRTDPAIVFLRGSVPSTLPGWQAARLPLTAANDDPMAPFPNAAWPPASVVDDRNWVLPLTLYVAEQPGNTLRAVKTAVGPRLSL